MDQQRIDFLRGELRAERISMGELIDIQGEFEKIDPATLRDRPENATAEDMLDEIEERLAFRCRYCGYRVPAEREMCREAPVSVLYHAPYETKEN